ncbi:helix-turn-helix domain-containing protein [Segniliparus rugosus]|uniref:HTH cro/C1-type domain-containing protein n=1 Tax=Segniliparus rugosus (strain ATCC BAA-974 / DSM 45345 / CCUG 50838 / CIP 108380 / JCM 13579 / CDC 945) TaxID=679197 RepID=E5XN27_SEGRC|nr:helix-turn-helix transcriptional regulator [Segniliparus rugosus]EFV14252.1 hypothetical protein HMPREF9336_00897 [Segniliparus rugosus ATCC BAA-974]
MGDLNRTVTLEVRGHLARRRLKRSDVANILEISLRTVSDLLGERRPWRVDEIETIAAWLDISVSDLLFPKHTSYSARRKKAPAEGGPFDLEASVFKFDPFREISAESDRSKTSENGAEFHRAAQSEKPNRRELGSGKDL